MLYIELPAHALLDKDDSGQDIITFNDDNLPPINLIEQVQLYMASGQQDSNCLLAVFRNCPKEDKTYIEYLPNNGQPALWITVVNGLEKNAFNQRTQSYNPWFYHQQNLRAERLAEVISDRAQVKEERYSKGPRSI